MRSQNWIEVILLYKALIVNVPFRPTIHIPNSLNLAFSNNPDAIPKRIDDTVTMNFLNTGPKDFLLKKGTPVTRAQLLRLGN